MRIYRRTRGPFYCGHWNGSPLEIAITDRLFEVPEGERLHYHEYREYYVNLDGWGELEIEGEIVALEPEMVVMVEPGERHRVASVCPERGARWAVVKERSEPGSKHYADED
jgi:mannose-6-phosphate isomerase-like protein (cupin superfamily)